MANEKSIESECEVFTKYLLGCSPVPYVVQKYTDAHQVAAVFSKGSPFDNLLVRVAGAHPTLTRLADSHARIFAPKGLLRKKLVLLLAILETSAPSYHLIDAVDGRGLIPLIFRLVFKGIAFVVSAVAGAIFFLPFQMILPSEQRKTG
jgi:hypothetical protein